MNPKDDPTSIGSILVKMGVITEEDLSAAVEEQENLSVEHLLGKLLVANGVCSVEQIEVALAAQQGMRSEEEHKQAVAIASIAMTRKRMVRVAGQRMISRGEEIARKSSSGIYPAVAMKMNMVGGGKKDDGTAS
jgi:hypothetical protein